MVQGLSRDHPYTLDPPLHFGCYHRRKPSLLGLSVSSLSSLGLEAIYPRLTGKKLVFIDRLLTANSAISISVFVSLSVRVLMSGCPFACGRITTPE